MKVSGAGEYKSERSSGVLQKDLVVAIQSSNNCKLVVFQTLERDLFAKNFSYNYFGFTKSSSADLNQIQDQELNPGAQQEAQNFVFIINGCLAMQEDVVSCPIMVENNGPDRQISLGGQSNQNYIVDEAGFTHTIKAIQLGSSHNNPAQTLAPHGVTLRGVVSYGGDGQPVQGRISRLFVNVSFVTMWFPVKWENVEVKR